MRRRLRLALVALSLTGALIGGGAAIASAANGSSSKTSKTPSKTMQYGSQAAKPSDSGNCPNM